MEELFLRFSHLSENIFDQLDDVSFAKCRSVSKQWKVNIDKGKTHHVRKIMTTVKKHYVDDEIHPWKRVLFKASTYTIIALSEAVEGSNHFEYKVI